MSDPVNHPDHYANSEIECIDAIRAAWANFGKGGGGGEQKN